MQVFQINRKETGLFSQQANNLAYNQNRFIPYIFKQVTIEAFEDAIDRKEDSFPDATRKVLVDALLKQYASVENTEKTKENIDSLANKNTYTITTGHQLSLFTGPLYFIYKILHVIKQTEVLNEKYKSYHFVPVYWMASEDHDFEEIQSAHIFGNNVTWESDQKGPVGRFDLEGLEKVKEEFSEFFANNPTAEIHGLLEALNGGNYADAFRKFIHTLFGEYGLVIVDGDSKELKQLFVPVMEKELVERFSFDAVSATNQELLNEGAKIQVTPRAVNLFYIEKGKRERIVFENDTYTTPSLGTLNQTQILAKLNEDPSAFSPNVVLRPVYQECILPNLNYIGGTGELSYWLQLKRVFEAVEIPYPLIQVRNSVIWIDGITKDKMNRLSMTIDNIFVDVHQLKNKYVESQEKDSLNFEELDAAENNLSKELLKSVMEVDDGLEKFALSEITRIEKQMNALKEKLLKRSKSKYDKTLKTYDDVFEKIYPNGKLQERTVNFFQMSPSGNYKDQLRLIKNQLDPFSPDLFVVID